MDEYQRNTIAIDLDGTIAELHEPTFERCEVARYEDFKRPNNGWGEDEWKEYKHHSSNVWHNHSDEISPIEPHVNEYIDGMMRHYHVTILTHRTNADSQIQDWLDEHDIPYDNFISTHKPKGDFGMEFYIDDSIVENMGDNQRQYLYNRPYNTWISSLARISSLGRFTTVYTSVDISSP